MVLITESEFWNKNVNLLVLKFNQKWLKSRIEFIKNGTIEWLANDAFSYGFQNKDTNIAGIVLDKAFFWFVK